MNTAETFWAEQDDLLLAQTTPRPPFVGTVQQSVKHIHALVRHGYHPKFVETALWAHLGKHGMRTS